MTCCKTYDERKKAEDDIAAAAKELFLSQCLNCSKELFLSQCLNSSNEVVAFNDHPSTTFDHVRLVLERAGL